MNIDKDKFLFMYEQQYFKTLLDAPKKGLLTLLDFIIKDEDINNIQHIAYMLATTFHETAGTWQPIAEYGKGKGRPYSVCDEATGEVYYGRGYVQLTWKDNYNTMGKILDVDLVNRPDKAMEPQIAYDIMSVGMRKGMFTGVSLKKFINESGCDYIKARKIINGTDCAEKIAGYAVKFESILKETV